MSLGSGAVASIDLRIISTKHSWSRTLRTNKSCTQPALAEVGAWTLIYRHLKKETRSLADYNCAVLTSVALI